MHPPVADDAHGEADGAASWGEGPPHLRHHTPLAPHYSTIQKEVAEIQGLDEPLCAHPLDGGGVGGAAGVSHDPPEAGVGPHEHGGR